MKATDRPMVLVADPLGQNGIDMLRRELNVVTAESQDDLPRHLSRADALVVRSRTRVTAQLLDGAPRLRLVARAGIGVDNVDVAAAGARGILVINAPLGNVRSTAEHTLALILALARRVVSADRAARDGRWKAGYEGMQLAGKRLGLLGAGKVGSQVAAMAACLGMEVTAYDPYIADDRWASLGLRPSTFPELLTGSDLISIHVPLSPETRGLVGEVELAAMKPGAYLVNCARGGLVDEAALIRALSSGHLGGAALDVFEEEPLPADSPLLSAPNLILTPHVAASTREAQAQVALDIAAQILDYFHGRPVAHPVNQDVLEVTA